MSEPLFILACPRSGTTLLAHLLAPTRWGYLQESHFIIKYARQLPRFGPLTDAGAVRRLVRAISRERPVRQWRLELDPEEAYASLSRFEYSEIVDYVCMQRAQRSGNEAWGDKTPAHVLSIDVLVGLFPNAKFLRIVRDGRDVAASLLRKPWGPGTVYHCADLWRRCNAPSATLDRLADRGLLFSVRYEELLECPQATLERIYDFLQEKRNPPELERLSRIVDPRNVGKWRTLLSSAQVDVFESAAARTLERFGYVTTHSETAAPTLARAGWAVANSTKSWIHLIRINTLDSVRIALFKKEPFHE